MATTHLGHTARETRVPGVDVAGTRWPLYKLEAVAIGLIVLVGAFALVGSLESAVLTAAAVALTVWWARRIQLLRRS